VGKRAKRGNSHSQLTVSGNCCKCQQHFLYMRVYRQPYLLMVRKRGGEKENRKKYFKRIFAQKRDGGENLQEIVKLQMSKEKKKWN